MVSLASRSSSPKHSISLFSGTKFDVVPKSLGGGRFIAKHVHEVVDQLCINHLTLPDVQDKAVFLIKSSLLGEMPESFM